jgi:hypothetical protein
MTSDLDSSALAMDPETEPDTTGDAPLYVSKQLCAACISVAANGPPPEVAVTALSALNGQACE